MQVYLFWLMGDRVGGRTGVGKARNHPKLKEDTKEEGPKIRTPAVSSVGTLSARPSLPS